MIPHFPLTVVKIVSKKIFHKLHKVLYNTDSYKGDSAIHLFIQ